MENSQQKSLVWDFGILTSMLIFGFYAIFLKLNPLISPLIFLWAFQFVGMVGYTLVCIIEGLLGKKDIAPERHHFWLLLALAVVALTNDLSLFAGLRLSPANAAVAHQMVSVFLVFFSPWLLHEPVRRSEWRAIGLSLFGILIMFANELRLGSSADFWGLTLGLISAPFYGLLIICYRKLRETGMSLTTVNTARYWLSTFLLLPIVLIAAPFTSLRPGDVQVLGWFGFTFAIVASTIHNFSISRARTLHASIIGKTEPAIVIFWAYLILGERPTGMQLVGGAIVVGASLWLAFVKEKETEEESPIKIAISS